jgi:hypothetical protein
MPKNMHDDNLAQDDDFSDEDNDWNEPAADNVPRDRDKTVSRSGPKWKAIEEYWEEKSLRDALQDYLTEKE